MEKSSETAPTIDGNEFKECLASGHGFNLYHQYNETQSANFLDIHPNTLKKIRKAGRISFLQKGERSIAYLGFQLADYLIVNIQSCQKQPLLNATKSESTGFPSKTGQRLGAELGMTPKLDKQSAVASARRILRKQNKN